MLLAILTSVGQVGAVHVAIGDFVVVPVGAVVLNPAPSGLVSWALCLVLGSGVLVVLVRQRPSGVAARLLATGAGLWALISLLTGGLLLGAVVSEGVGALVYNRMTEVRRSPSTACTVVLTETATFDEATERVYVVGAFGFSSPTGDVTVQHGRPLRAGRAVVRWRTGGGSVSYGGEQQFDVTRLDFTC